MDLKKPKVIRASAPDADLYEKPKKDKKVTDKDLFVMKGIDKKKNKKSK